MHELPQQEYSIYKDPGYRILRRELKYATIRLIVNGTIILFDIAPGHLANPNEYVSIAADVFKYGRHALRWSRLGKYLPNTTPDAGWISTIATEFTVDPITLGNFPSHAAETMVQVGHDIRRLQRFGRVRWQAFRGADHQEIRKYLYEASKNDRIFADLLPQPPTPLSDLSAQEIIEYHVPQQLPFP